MNANDATADRADHIGGTFEGNPPANGSFDLTPGVTGPDELRSRLG